MIFFVMSVMKIAFLCNKSCLFHSQQPHIIKVMIYLQLKLFFRMHHFTIVYR